MIVSCQNHDFLDGPILLVEQRTIAESETVKGRFFSNLRDKTPVSNRWTQRRQHNTFSGYLWLVIGRSVENHCFNDVLVYHRYE